MILLKPSSTNNSMCIKKLYREKQYNASWVAYDFFESTLTIEEFANHLASVYWPTSKNRWFNVHAS